jgi:hypothetical protein
VSVTLNEAALVALFQSPPVVAYMQRTAEEKIVSKMKEDVRSYFAPAETTAEDDVGLRMEGSTAIVGLRDDPQGRSSRRGARGESKSARYARVGEWRLTREAAGQ